MNVNKEYISYVIFALVFIIVFLFSYYTVWLGDDINYMFSFVSGKRDQIVTSLPDIIESQNEHYFEVNGRYAPHILVQLCCGILGHTAFSVFNGLFYMLFLIVLCRLCRVKMNNVKGVTTVVLLSLLTFQTKMTPSCQIGYIWTFAFMMIFLILFFDCDTPKWQWWKIILAVLFSLYSGNGQEALSLGISGALIVYWCYNMKRMSIAQYAMMIAFGIGTLIICLSPATRARATEESTGILSYIISWGYAIVTSRALYFLLIVVALYIVKHKNTPLSIYKQNVFLWNALIILVCFNGLIGYNHRALFGIELLSIIIGIRMLQNHALDMIWLVVIGIMLFVLYVYQMLHIHRVGDTLREIETQYEYSNDGKVYVAINDITQLPPSTNFSPLLPHYGIKNVDIYESECLQRYLCHKYSSNKILQILPPDLKNWDNSLSDTIIPLPSGHYLIVKNKHNIKDVLVKRSMEFCGYKKDLGLLKISIDKYPHIYETKDWVAYQMDPMDYIVGYSFISHVEFVVK